MDLNERQHILHYARAHGLTHDPSTDPDIDPAAFLDSPEDQLAALEDPDDAVQLPTHPLPSEKLSLDKEARVLLRYLFAPHQAEQSAEKAAFERKRQLKRLKLDLPVLKTDHEYDVRLFRQKTDRILNQDIAFSPIPVDEQNDEGLTWPARYRQLKAEYDYKAYHEKVEIPRSTLTYLKDALSHDLTDEEKDDIYSQGLKYRRVS